MKKELLLNPEELNKFIQMFEGRIKILNGELKKVEDAKTQIKTGINELTEKRDTMLNYLKMINGKGFGYMKQQLDDHFEKMGEANTDRLTEGNKYCNKSYTFMNKPYNCLKNKRHRGECGVI